MTVVSYNQAAASKNKQSLLDADGGPFSYGITEEKNQLCRVPVVACNAVIIINVYLEFVERLVNVGLTNSNHKFVISDHDQNKN